MFRVLTIGEVDVLNLHGVSHKRVSVAQASFFSHNGQVSC